MIRAILTMFPRCGVSFFQGVPMAPNFSQFVLQVHMCCPPVSANHCRWCVFTGSFLAIFGKTDISLNPGFGSLRGPGSPEIWRGIPHRCVWSRHGGYRAILGFPGVHFGPFWPFWQFLKNTVFWCNPIAEWDNVKCALVLSHPAMGLVRHAYLGGIRVCVTWGSLGVILGCTWHLITVYG